MVEKFGARIPDGPHVSTSTHITWQPLMQMSNKWRRWTIKTGLIRRNATHL